MARFSRRRRGILLLFIACVISMFMVIWFMNNSNKHTQVVKKLALYDEFHDERVGKYFEGQFDSDFSIISGVNLTLRNKNSVKFDKLKLLTEMPQITPLPGFILRKKILRDEIFGHKDPSKYLFIIGHYEQLGKTTINFINAGSLAASSGRKLVAPFVRNSRFTGMPSGWYGNVRVGSRAFYSWEKYFDVESFQNMFKSHNLSAIVSLNQFRKNCAISSGEEITLVYFMYEKDEIATRRYLNLSDQQFHKLLNNTQSHNWVECRILNKVLQLHNRIGNVSIGRQLCVNAEKLTNAKEFESDILKGDKCVAIVYWRGIGEKRTHFDVSLVGQESSLLKELKPSQTIQSEVERFITEHLHGKFIGVHIRSERLLQFSGLKTFDRCLNTAQQFLRKYGAKFPMAFVSDDVSLHGSDTLGPLINESSIDITKSRILNMISRFNAKIYHVKKQRDAYWTDTGVVALVQMHILAKAQHLITVGDGNFQEWVINTFRRQKELISDKSWRIIRVCASGTAAPTQSNHFHDQSAHLNLTNSIQT